MFPRGSRSTLLRPITVLLSLGDGSSNVGYHDVRHSLTEGRLPCTTSFAAESEARSRERQRILRKVGNWNPATETLSPVPRIY